AGAEEAAGLTIHPIPPGTRDVLPDEMRELRRLNLALVDVFERFGYGEVQTPTIEYDEVMARGDGRAAGSTYRFFDERGDLLSVLGIEGEPRDAVLKRLAMHDLVGLEVELSELQGIGTEQRETLIALSQMRGGREVLSEARSIGGQAVERATERIQGTYDALE